MALKGINAHVSSTSTHALGSHVGVSLLADSPTGEHRFLCLNSEPIDFEGLLTTLDEQAVPLTGAISLSPKNVERLIICSAAYNQDHAVAI